MKEFLDFRHSCKHFIAVMKLNQYVLVSFFLFLLLPIVVKAQTIYCTPTSSCQISSWISKVSFSTINNSSGCSTANGYENYTASVAAPRIMAGTTVPVTITIPYSYLGTSDVAVWIDYNRNGSFEMAEHVYIGSAASGVLSGSITLPPDAAGGATRMRVRRRVNGTLTASDACLSYAYGETEDYHIFLQKIKITHTSFSDTLYDPFITLRASIVQTDFGVSNTDSLRPRLWARRYGTSDWVKVKGALVSGTTTNGQWDFMLALDSISLRKNGCDSLQYYFVAQDVNTLSYIEYLPSGGNHVNVQVQVTRPPSLFGFRTRPRLKDTIYMGTSNTPICQCNSLSNEKGIFQDINTKGLEGALTLIVEKDLKESGTYSLNGTMLNNYQVWLRPDASIVRTIEATGPNAATIKLDSVKNLTVDGSYNGVGHFLRFRNKTAIDNYDTICNIKLNHSCDTVTIRNAIFEHQSYSEYNNSASIWLADGDNQRINITDNLFQQITGSTSWPKKHILSVYGNNKAHIKRNEFSNFLQSGVDIASGQNWIIDSNHFFRTSNPAGVYGLDFSAINVAGGGHQITNNYIGGQAKYAAGGSLPLINDAQATLAGIRINAPAGINPVLVQHNYIANINASVTFTSVPAMFAGIFCNSNNSIIKQNTIGSLDTSSYSIKVLANFIFGVTVWGTHSAHIVDNTIAGITNNLNPGQSGDVIMCGIYTALADTVSSTITDNDIFHLKNTENSAYNSPVEIGGTIGISVRGGLSNKIERNKIYDLNVTRLVVSGIAFNRTSGTQPSVIQRNRVHDLFNTNTSPRSCCNFDDNGKSAINGIAIGELNNDLDILNNQLTLTNRRLAYPVTIRGIFEAGLVPSQAKQRIIYNTIYIGGTSVGNDGSAAITMYNQSVSTIYNNLFFNQRKGGDLGHFIYRIQRYPPDPVLAATKANNNFYVQGDTTRFAQWGYTPAIGWRQWQVNTGLDDSSSTKPLSEISSSQLFVNKNGGNLNIDIGNATCWEVNEKGIPFIDSKDDYDAVNIRAAVLPGRTDIGSDEFIPAIGSPGRACGCTCRLFTAGIGGSSYQWQVDTGTGYTTISDNTFYSGTQSERLQLNDAPTAWYGNKYRCLITTLNNIAPGIIYTLSFSSRWTGAASSLWTDPANWECGILPDANRDAIVNDGLLNYPFINSNVTCRTITVEEGATLTIGAGYTLTITH